MGLAVDVRAGSGQIPKGSFCLLIGPRSCQGGRDTWWAPGKPMIYRLVDDISESVGKRGAIALLLPVCMKNCRRESRLK